MSPRDFYFRAGAWVGGVPDEAVAAVEGALRLPAVCGAPPGRGCPQPQRYALILDVMDGMGGNCVFGKDGGMNCAEDL